MKVNILKDIKSYWKTYIYWFFIVSFSALIPILSINSFYLPGEIQVMYVSSTSAQVIAALFGLTVTGYIFFDGKLKSYVNEDSSLQDIINDLRSSFRDEIIMISILCFASMTFAFLNILLNTIDESKKLQSLLTLECVFYSFHAILHIMIFVIKVINPYLIKERSIKLQKQFEDFDGEESPENLTTFLRKYNQLESFINSYASNIINNDKGNKLSNDNSCKNTFQQDMNILVSSGYISKEMFDQINQIRKYRNTIVHGQDMQVSQKALKELSSVLNNMQGTIAV